MQYKITRIYIVQAPTRAAAIQTWRQAKDHTEFLEYESITLVQEKEGWGAALKKQVIGK